jgi:dTDP-4-dehydrorhamnose reductase
MRILIIGASGMLGTDLVNHWPDDDVISATSRDADILAIEQVRSLVLKTRPDWIILTAAYTDVDGSERHPDHAFAVNCKGAENVTRVASETGSRLFYVSTDYIFDGLSQRPYEPDDTVAPLNVYGASKAAGEKAVMSGHKEWCIARTSWLFGAAGASFPEKILRAAETRPELNVVADQVGSPTFTRDCAEVIRALIRADARGIIHVTNSGSCSWFDFAREILRQAGRHTVLVRPISTVEAGRLAKRPAYSVLSSASLNSFGIAMRSWHEALPDYLKDLRDRGKLD